MIQTQGGDARPAQGSEDVDEGVVARLPFVGTLRWRCQNLRGTTRFFTRLTLPDPGATVFVSVTSDGRSIVRNRQVDPPHPGEPSRGGPFAARRSQAWTIRFDHKNAGLTARVRMRFRAPEEGSGCVVSRTLIDVRRRR